MNEAPDEIQAFGTDKDGHVTFNGKALDFKADPKHLLDAVVYGHNAWHRASDEVKTLRYQLGVQSRPIVRPILQPADTWSALAILSLGVGIGLALAEWVL